MHGTCSTSHGGLVKSALLCSTACVLQVPLRLRILHVFGTLSLADASVCRTMQYKHVGSPIFLDRTGEALPGEYVAFRGERPEWYTGSIGDHVSGYILGIKQAAECTVRT